MPPQWTVRIESSAQPSASRGAGGDPRVPESPRSDAARRGPGDRGHVSLVRVVCLERYNILYV